MTKDIRVLQHGRRIVLLITVALMYNKQYPIMHLLKQYFYKLYKYRVC